MERVESARHECGGQVKRADFDEDPTMKSSPHLRPLFQTRTRGLGTSPPVARLHNRTFR